MPLTASDRVSWISGKTGKTLAERLVRFSEAVGVETATFLSAHVNAVSDTCWCDLARLERLAVDVRVAGIESNFLASDGKLGRISSKAFTTNALGAMISTDTVRMRSAASLDASVCAVSDTLRVGQTSLKFGTIRIVEAIVEDRLAASVRIVGVAEERVTANAGGAMVDRVAFCVRGTLLGKANVDALVSFGLVSTNFVDEAVSVDLAIIRNCGVNEENFICQNLY